MDRKMKSSWLLGRETTMCINMYRSSIVSASTEERFCDGLNGDLYGRLNLLEPNNYHELVNKAISQEDAMRKAQKDRK
jgi:hypothetical protein